MDHSMPGMPDHSPSSLPCKVRPPHLPSLPLAHPLAHAQMSMLWNTSPTGICLVFPSLQITASPFSLLFYLAFITLLALSCEYLRLALASFDRQLRSELRGGLGPVSNGAAGVGGRPSTPIGGMRRPSALHLDAGADEALLGARGSVAGIGGAQGRYWGVVRLPFFLQVRRSLGYALHVALTVRPFLPPSFPSLH